MSVFDVFLRLFGGGNQAGEPELRFGFRGEDITYRQSGREVEITFTHMLGPRIYVDTISRWTDGVPLTEVEKSDILARVLPFVRGNFEKPTVVINVDDPSRTLWERLCEAHRAHVRTVEYTSNDEQARFVRDTYLRILKGGGGLVIDDTEIRSEQELDRFLEERRKTRGA